MSLILFLCELFQEENAPYTLKEITECLQSTLDKDVTIARISYAFTTLSLDDATAEIVRPISSRKRYYQFSAKAARLIARRALSRDIQKILRAKSRLSDG